jgi:ADP-dependent NAD(P)H-hydrate dehydratase / NAD(P)H-hydrate epimerase
VRKPKPQTKPKRDDTSLAGRGLELLTVAQMGRADALTVAAGISGEALMLRAGQAVAAAIRGRWSPRPVAVLAGPGNNGGDGFVVARLLAESGWPVTLALLGSRERLRGDAARHAALWRGPTAPLEPAALRGAELAVDALFGAGLDREIIGPARVMIEAIADRRLPVVAVDIPSGVHGDSGAILGVAPQATVTVTFFRKKPGHLLFPGRGRVGELLVADIGIPETVLAEIAPRQFENHPALWLAQFPRLDPAGHKYARGHAVVVGGPLATGATQLAARGALRAGAGLVTIAAPAKTIPIHAASFAEALLAPLSAAGFTSLLADPRKNAVLLGPGNGVTAATRGYVLAALAAGKRTVLDADALTVFASAPARLFRALHAECVLTPHEGEFARLFASSCDKLSRAREAAAKSGAVVLLKGADTVIAAWGGEAVVNSNAPPTLATAGSGDVLAGMLVGLLAQGMPVVAAAAAAVWLHGDAARRFGPGLIASDVLTSVCQSIESILEMDC